MKMIRSAVLGVTMICATAVSAHAAVLLVDDFDDISKPNFLGGNFGAWDKDQGDTTQYCVDSFDGDIKNGATGYALKLDYDVDSPNPAYNGFWMDLNNADLRQYNALVFYAKGDENEGYTTQFKVELKGANGDIGRYLVTGVSSEWQKIVVPFRKVNGLTDWSAVSQFVVVFDDINATDKDGVLFLDDISFQSL